MTDFTLSQALSPVSDDDDIDHEPDNNRHHNHSPPPHQTLITPVIRPSSSSSRRRAHDNIHIVQTTPTSSIPTTTSDSGRKPRGRPPGSKNKPKPPIYITRETQPTTKTQQLEIPSGLDIIEMVQTFAAKNRVGVNIINGFGSIGNVMLKYPGIQGQSISLSGTFELLSVSGMFMGPNILCSSSTEKSSSSSSSTMGSHYLAVFLAGNGAQVFGGVVMGKVVAASNVLLNVTTFGSCEYHRLRPEEVDEGDDEVVESKPVVGIKAEGATASGGMYGGGGGGQCQSPSPMSSHAPEVLNWTPSAARSPHF